ncbi:MAG: hypothetical protein GF350_07880 [Chitinivibrionales bacterium]|nr:hypothetical protein [Chitinivibrionales bacterium]
MIQKSNKQASSTKRRRSNLVVDAIVVPTPALKDLIRSQNVVNFFISCLEDIGDRTFDLSQGAEMGAQCIDAMKRVKEQDNFGLPEQIDSVLDEFIMETEEIIWLFEDVDNDVLADEKEFASFIEAKTYKMQYLSNVLTSEIETLKHRRISSCH